MSNKSISIGILNGNSVCVGPTQNPNLRQLRSLDLQRLRNTIHTMRLNTTILSRNLGQNGQHLDYILGVTHAMKHSELVALVGMLERKSPEAIESINSAIKQLQLARDRLRRDIEGLKQLAQPVVR